MKSRNREREIFRVTGIGSLVNIFLLIFKFVAGILGNSSAMIADAVHSLSDFITDIIVVVFVKISGKPEDKEHHYGHGKFETLATAIIGVILFFVGVGILINGIEVIVNAIKGEAIKSPSILALIAATISIILKEILFRYTIHKGKSLNSQAVIANAWHHRSDVFSSIGTFAGICGAVCLGNK